MQISRVVWAMLMVAALQACASDYNQITPLLKNDARLSYRVLGAYSEVSGDRSLDSNLMEEMAVQAVDDLLSATASSLISKLNSNGFRCQKSDRYDLCTDVAVFTQEIPVPNLMFLPSAPATATNYLSVLVVVDHRNPNEWQTFAAVQ